MPMPKLSGLKPLIIEADPIEIEGQTYQFRRLGMVDTMSVLTLGNKTWLFGMQDGLRHLVLAMDSQISQGLAVDFGAMLPFVAPILGIPIAQEWIFNFFAQTLKRRVTDGGEEEWEDIALGDFEDPTLFPMGSEITLLRTLLRHPDLLTFFKNSAELKTDPALPTLLDLIRTKSTGAGSQP